MSVRLGRSAGDGVVVLELGLELELELELELNGNGWDGESKQCISMLDLGGRGHWIHNVHLLDSGLRLLVETGDL
jgi:hypothetical protein